jgi:hypothetical protein
MHAKSESVMENAAGLRLLVDDRNVPALRIEMPEGSNHDAVRVVFPEHITARRSGSQVPRHLYLAGEAQPMAPPVWRQDDQSWEYQRNLDGVHLLARVLLEDDGACFRYEFTNQSSVSLDMIYAVTDPWLGSFFHDVRLERTYVHHADGFDLLASETPERLVLPLNRWLPSRYTASCTWPVPPKRVQHRDDGVIQYNKSRPIDQPLIATVSIDHSWIAASFAREVGNVWTNPEITCLHADPQICLPAGQRKAVEIKLLIFRGSLDQALHKVKQQRETLD